ncbi:MAG: YfhO family protein [Blastocatellia bacterium]
MKPRPTSARVRFLPDFSERTANLLAILFLLLLPFVFFWRETLGRLTLGDQDALFWFFPIYKLVAEQIRAGHLPLWNPYMYSGMPLFAQPQAGVFDPINWIYLLGANSRTLTLAQEISFGIALLAAFSYVRSLGWKRRSGVITAVIYALSGFAVARTIYPGLLHIFALTPLPLAVIERIYQRANTADQSGWRLAVAGSFVVAWQIFAGHPQPFLYSSLLAGSYALFCAFFRSDQFAEVSEPGRGRQFNSFRFLLQCAVMYLAGAGLAAVQLLPAAEFARQSVRQEWTYEMFTAHSLHPVSLLTALFPYFHGSGKEIYHLPFWGRYWHHNEAQIYLGALALSLAVTGFVVACRARFSVGIFWGIVAIMAGLLSMGRYVPLLPQLIYRIPVLNGFRSPNRHWMEVTLAVAVLAGFGVEYLLREIEGTEKSKNHFTLSASGIAGISSLVITLFCAACGLFVLAFRQSAESFIRRLPELSSLPGDFLKEAGAEFYVPVISAAAALLVIIAFTRNRQRCYPLLLLVLLGDFYLYAFFAPINSAKKTESVMGRAIPAAISNEAGIFRYHQVLAGAGAGDFRPDWFYGSEMTSGYDPLVSLRYKTFSGIDEAGHSYLISPLETKDCTLDLLNVRYALVPETVLTSSINNPAKSVAAALNDSSRWQQVNGLTAQTEAGVQLIYKNLRSLPRAWLVGQVAAAFEGDQLKIIRGDYPEEKWRNFDPRQTALAEPETAGELAAAGLNASTLKTDKSPGEVLSFTRESPAEFQVEVHTAEPAMLIISEIAFPGWRAEVDGASTRIHRVNYALQGVIIQPGKHLVKFTYFPASLLTGTLISGATVLLLMSLLFVTSYARRTLRFD